jgi:hypothetical protein
MREYKEIFDDMLNKGIYNENNSPFELNRYVLKIKKEVLKNHEKFYYTIDMRKKEIYFFKRGINLLSHKCTTKEIIYDEYQIIIVDRV